MSVRLEAVEYCEGPPLAILHGLFGSGRNWAGVAQRLAAHHRVIAFDLRNHGASPWADTMDYAEMAEDVRAAMRARGHRRFALLGHSMGGMAAMSKGSSWSTSPRSRMHRTISAMSRRCARWISAPSSAGPTPMPSSRPP